MSLSPEPAQDSDGAAPREVILLLRMEEAAERLGIARTLMYQLVRTGDVESVRVGRLRRVPVACLEEYVSRLREAAHGDGSSAA